MTTGVSQFTKRRHPCWLAEFTRRTAHTGSPEIYRRWTGLAAIASAIGRKRWMKVRGRELFPNLYVLLIGPPGIGKTTAIREGRELLVRAGVPTSPAMISKEKFLLLYANAMKSVLYKGVPFIHTSYSVNLDEFSVFLRPLDEEFMTVLTDLYDCQRLFVYSTLNRKDDIRIENSCLNIIGGTTVKSIGKNFGAEAIGMGFTARLFMVFSEDVEKTDLWLDKPLPNSSDLVEDLAAMHATVGEITISEPAMDHARAWYNAGCPPLPADSRFAEYNPRRHIHWLKLSMLIATSKGEAVIETSHLEEAKAILLEMEAQMPMALEFIGSNPMANAVKSLHKWLMIEYALKKSPISESRIRRFLIQDIPVQYHDDTIENLVNTSLVKVATGFSPARTFIPQKRVEE